MKDFRSRAEKGFTLIELMIVVAIIGILAAIALPAYQDYVTKGKVSEAASLSSAAVTAVTVAYSDGTLTASSNNSSLGLAASITGKYAASVTAAGTGTDSGTVTVVMQGTGQTTVDGSNIIYIVACTDAAQCRTTIDATSSVPVKYLPKT